MGAHAGVFFFDGRPPDREGQTLTATLAPLAPDGVSIVTDDGVAMAYGALHLWSGERAAGHPRRSASGLMVTWDGRLDNRDEVSSRLDGSVGADATDADLAVATFERDGADGLRSLVGDWSVVIWDRRRRTLWMARDYMGVRPLFYYRDSRTVRWSTSLGELAVRSGCVDALDETFVAGFLALRFSTDVTPYRGIRAVPTATCVKLSADGSETRQRFWTLEPGTVRFRDPRLYEDRLRALWRDAVGARLRTDDVAWAELSGGFDSSSIVCMADALIKQRDVPATAVRPLSHVTLESREGDERRFIAEVESQIGVRTEVVPIERHLDAVDADGEWETPCAARGVGLASVRRVREAGGRLILSGRVGDVVMGCAPDNSVASFDDIVEGRLRDALAKLRLWSRASRKPLVEIARDLVRELGHARSPIRIGHGLNDTQLAGIDLLTPRLQRLAFEFERGRLSPAHVRTSQYRRAEILLDYSREARLNIPSQPPGITYTYPFVHRPLVEFILAIPGEELSAPGQTRALMRRAFAGLVPARILRRVSKGYYPPAMMRAVRSAAATLPPGSELEVVRRGWIDPVRFDAALRDLLAGSGRSGGEVDRVLRLEQWLISRQRRAPAAIPTRKEVTSNAVLIA